MLHPESPLHSIVTTIMDVAGRMGMSYRRGGYVKGVHWAEIAGCSTDGTWHKLRLRRHLDGRLQAGLIAYLPIRQGGRTRLLGEASLDGLDQGAYEEISERILTWISAITP